MQKEGLKVFNSKEGRVNLALLISIIVVFILTMVFAEAMTVTLRTPGDLTFNTTTGRNINFTFNATWFGGSGAATPHENVSNCSLYINSTTNAIKWDIAKNVSNGTASGTGTDNLTDNLIQNGSSGLSYMNYTFSRDGNFTFSIACYNFSNNSNAARLEFSSNFSVFIDTTPPAFNFSELNVSIYNTSVVAQRIIEFKLNDSGLGINLSYNGSINISIFLYSDKQARRK